MYHEAKTINANMLGAYYSKGYESWEIFDTLKISLVESYLLHLNQHNVIYIDFSRMPDICSSYQDYILSVLKNLKDDLSEAYPKLKSKKYDSISAMLCDTGDTFIFIMDEWDSIFYADYVEKEDKNHFLRFLRGLLKDQPYVDLAYMTGVFPIAKYSSGSELNMFWEYNFLNDHTYEEYFGLNEDEVLKLCDEHGTVCYHEVKKWYDGYYMSDGRSLFNPRSVNCALSNGVCLNYWTETGPMNEIAECIEHNIDEVREDIVKMVAGISVPIKLKGYSASELQMNTRDEILSAMVVYGFLSYHDGCLNIPNHELMEKYQDVLTRNSMGEVKNCGHVILVAVNYNKAKNHECMIEKMEV